MARGQYCGTLAPPAEAKAAWVFGPVPFSLVAEPLRDFGPAIPTIAEPELSPLEVDTPEIQTPQLQATALIDSAENLPPLILDRLVTGPFGPPAASHVFSLPLALLSLTRGAADERKQQSGRLPAFKSVPVRALAVPSEPIFSFKPLPLARFVGTNQAAAC